nr:RecName: Full=Factor X-activator 1 heavy chain; Short=VAFXA-I HC; AltName: Full=Snake venom metalloproteinase; Short=SVMP [Vipera ammodytes ammodytes]
LVSVSPAFNGNYFVE